WPRSKCALRAARSAVRRPPSHSARALAARLATESSAARTTLARPRQATTMRSRPEREERMDAGTMPIGPPEVNSFPRLAGARRPRERARARAARHPRGEPRAGRRALPLRSAPWGSPPGRGDRLLRGGLPPPAQRAAHRPDGVGHAAQRPHEPPRLSHRERLAEPLRPPAGRACGGRAHDRVSPAARRPDAGRQPRAGGRRAARSGETDRLRAALELAAADRARLAADFEQARRDGERAETLVAALGAAERERARLAASLETAAAERAQGARAEAALEAARAAAERAAASAIAELAGARRAAAANEATAAARAAEWAGEVERLRT